ncbi:hypothetical protein NDU88_004588 [Pleurodeles waltl]|uniref:Uncharacterized protein n=1 Tax=Pleurodeles waltl TaxID=8319 RepID=A0AAV7WY91_PLEWA|nr:hypothetical protein NDU88_004588 [Pleurodeles waltl]
MVLLSRVLLVSWDLEVVPMLAGRATFSWVEGCVVCALTCWEVDSALAPGSHRRALVSLLKRSETGERSAKPAPGSRVGRERSDLPPRWRSRDPSTGGELGPGHCAPRVGEAWLGSNGGRPGPPRDSWGLEAVLACLRYEDRESESSWIARPQGKAAERLGGLIKGASRWWPP